MKAVLRKAVLQRAAIPRSFLVGACVYALAYFFLDYLRYRNYDTGSDFGVYMQSVSDPSGMLRNVEGSHFLSHFSPMYDLVMPFVIWSGSSCVPLLAFQALSGTAVGFGLLFFARGLLLRGLAPRVAALAFIYPPLAGVIFGDPNETFLAPAVTVWLFAFIYSRKWLLATAAALLALSIKEDQGLLLAWNGCCLAVWALRQKDEPLARFSIGLFIVSISVLLTYVYVIRPAVGEHAGWLALNRALAPAPSDASAGRSIFGRLGYVLEILVPLAFLPLAGTRMLIFAVPAIAEVLLAPNSAVWTMGEHYAGVWIGYVLLCMVCGVRAISDRSSRVAGAFVTAAISLSVADLVLASPTHWRIHLHPMSAHDRELDRALRDLPRDGTLGTHDELYAHLWRLPKLRYELEQSPHYALVDTTMKSSISSRRMIRDLREDTFGTYRLLWNKDGLRLYVRR